MIGSYISIYGEVQGSGYRMWAKEQGSKLNLTGWARKASDGSIEMFVQGEEDKINDFVSLCWDGPNTAFIDEVLVKDTNLDDSISSFEIL
jgi:acylphosphatase